MSEREIVSVFCSDLPIDDCCSSCHEDEALGYHGCECGPHSKRDDELGEWQCLMCCRAGGWASENMGVIREIVKKKLTENENSGENNSKQ